MRMISLFLLVLTLIICSGCPEPPPPTKEQIMWGHFSKAGVKFTRRNIELTKDKRVKMYILDLSDLTPVKDIPLEALMIANRKLTDLSPIKNMPLTCLVIRDTAVRDISALKDMKLTVLDMIGAPVADLSPLTNMPLIHMMFTEKAVTNGLDGLRNIPTLKLINKMTPEDYWKDYDMRRSIFE